MASRVPARVSRISSESLNSARLSAGMSRCCSPSQVRKLTGIPANSTVCPRPVDGSQPSCTENTMISSRPTQKVGSEKPRIEPAMIVRAANECGRMPAIRPSGIPSSTAISMAVSASSKVAGMRSNMSWIAGTLWVNERPRSPERAWRTNSAYCFHSGWSSPSAAVTRAISAWSACGLIRISTGLPIMYTPTKISSDITASAIALCSRRRIRKASMSTGDVSVYRPEFVRQSALVGARRIGDAFAGGPQVDLVIQRDDAQVADRDFGRLLQQLLAPGVVDSGERLVERRIHFGIRILAAVGCAHAALAVGGGEQGAQRRRRFGGYAAPADQQQAEFELGAAGEIERRGHRLHPCLNADA